MADPRRLFDSKDMQGAILYAKRVSASDDAWPILADADGNILTTTVAGKTFSSSSGTTTLTNTTILIAGSNKSKVYAFSLTTTSTTGVICAFQSGVGGAELWRVLLQAPNGASAGANLAVSPPANIFQTGSATLLNLSLSAAVRVDFSVAYFDEA